MGCLAGIGNLLIWLVVFCAGVAIIRVLIAAVLGAPGWWPSWPSFAGAPAPPPGGPALSRVAAVLLAILDIIFWAAILIALILFVIQLLGCLSGFAHLPRLTF